MKLRTACCRTEIVVEPTAMSSITRTTIIINAMSPRAWVNGLSLCQSRVLLIGMVDVGIDDVSGKTTIEQIEL